MYDISYNRPLPGKHSLRDSLANALRRMRYKGDSFEVPREKKQSVYSAARAASVKVTIRETGNGKAIVWRIDGPGRPQLPRTEDELRPFYTGYMDRHSVQGGMDVLKSFGCDFLSEAIALDAVKLGALVEALTHDEGIFE